MATAVIAEATGKPLSTIKEQQLSNWINRYGTYQIRPVYLLSTRQPEQLAEVACQRRFKERIQQQVSPRHAIVSPNLIPPLQRWLEQKGHLLDTPSEDTEINGLPDPAYAWLGLQLLTDISDLLHLSLRPSPTSLTAAAEQLSATEIADLEMKAETIMAGLRQAIRGRDAFFPAEKDSDEKLLALIREAVSTERCLTIAYQSLVDPKPYWRKVYPLRLEQRGAVYYLHAYCHLAEANRTFRLDRIGDYKLSAQSRHD